VFAGHRLQQRLEIAPLAALQGQIVDHLPESGGVSGLAGDVSENFLFAEHFDRN